MASKGLDMWGDLPEDAVVETTVAPKSKASDKPLEDGEHEIIERPNVLKAKAGPGTGMDMGVVSRAEKIIDQHKAGYEIRIAGELEDLDALFTEMHLTKRYQLKRILNAAHEIRGEAGTFDYPLLSEVARSLCELLPKISKPSTLELEVIETHIKTMRTIVAHQIKGDGGELGKQVVAGLVKAVGKLKKANAKKSQSA